MNFNPPTRKPLSQRFPSSLPFYYGYVMMFVAMMVQICSTPGQTFAVSAFTPALRDGLQLSDSQLSFAYMLGTILAAFPLALVGPLADRLGMRGITTTVVIALASTCWAASTVDGFWGILLVFLMLRFLGQGALSLLGGNTVAMWFRTKLGRVSAVMSIGTAIAFAWAPQWLSDSIALHGWRQTYVALAIVVAGIMLPVMLLLFHNRPEDLGQCLDGELPDSIRSNSHADADSPVVTEQLSADTSQPESHGAPSSRDPFKSIETDLSWSYSQASRTRSFWILALINASWAMVGTGILFHLYTLCADRGLSTALPSNLFKVFGLAMLVMQLTGGVLADFWRLSRLLGVGVCMLTAGLLMLSIENSTRASAAFAALFGAGQGLLIAVNGVIWARYYGREHLGKIRGTVWCMTVAGSGCGPFLMGLARDYAGSFDVGVIAFLILFLPLSLVVWWANTPTTAATP